MAKFVKVARQGQRIVEVALDDNATVRTALSAAGMAVESGEKLTVNAVETGIDSPVADGAIVLLTRSYKGA